MDNFVLRSFVGDDCVQDHPIQVSNTQFSSLYFATCPSVSSLVSGSGKTVLEALVNMVTVANILNRCASDQMKLGYVGRYILLATNTLERIES